VFCVYNCNYNLLHGKEAKIKNEPLKNDEQIIIRLPKNLKEEFKKALLKNDAIQSNVVRRCIREYIKKSK